MKRGGSLKRSTFIRRRPMRRRLRSTRYSRRDRHRDYMMFVKTLDCSAWIFTPCEGPIEADHAGRRGIGQKAHDNTVIPLCTKHHAERTDFTGAFKTWDQATMREWLAESIARTQQRARYVGIEIPTT